MVGQLLLQLVEPAFQVTGGGEGSAAASRRPRRRRSQTGLGLDDAPVVVADVLPFDHVLDDPRTAWSATAFQRRHGSAAANAVVSLQ